jgi:nucleotide-binding universal stress UspA family protein
MNGLEKAIRLSKASGAKLRILHVVDGIAFSREHSMFTATAEKFRESGGKLIKEVMARVKKEKIQADSRMVENLTGRAADTIAKEASKWKADVIVMGTHGRRGFNRLMLGSDAELVARTATVSVLLVQPSKKTRRVRKKK